MFFLLWNMKHLVLWKGGWIIFGGTEALRGKLGLGPGVFDHSALRTQTLATFYQGNQLAHAVALGNDSYEERVAPILARYDTIYGKAFAPTQDDVFDMNVRVIESMNSVGVVKFDSERVTTEGIREEISLYNKLTCGVGAILGLFTTPVVYRFLESVGSGYEEAALGAYVLGAAVVTNLFLRPINNSIIGSSLSELEVAAKATDDYLKQIGVPSEVEACLQRRDSGEWVNFLV